MTPAPATLARVLASLLLATLALPTPALPATPPQPADCAPTGNLRSYCGLPGPEDIELLPGGGAAIVSDMRIAAGRPKSLKWVDLKTGAVTALYPSAAAPPARPGWGDPACTGEIGGDLQPHGTSLSRRPDGAWQLLVVNHGKRESVELFELRGKPGRWSLGWRGCVVPPAPNRLNDVAALPGGGFVVTTMHRLGDGGTAEAIRLSQAGVDTGFLWRWTPKEGLTKQPGSDTPRPNGVQVDAAGRYAYLFTANRGGDVTKLDLAQGRIVGSVALSKPDNGSWAADGRLLSISMAPDAMTPCLADPAAPCRAAFDVYAVDPGAMTAERLFSHAGAPIGGATVAVQAGSDLLIGSLFGDRIVAVSGVFEGRSGRSTR